MMPPTSPEKICVGVEGEEAQVAVQPEQLHDLGAERDAEAEAACWNSMPSAPMIVSSTSAGSPGRTT